LAESPRFPFSLSGVRLCPFNVVLLLKDKQYICFCFSIRVDLSYSSGDRVVGAAVVAIDGLVVFLEVAIPQQ